MAKTYNYFHIERCVQWPAKREKRLSIDHRTAAIEGAEKLHTTNRYKNRAKIDHLR